jgi:hypothetical protein
VHAGIVSKSQKIPEFRPILEFATDRPWEVVLLRTLSGRTRITSLVAAVFRLETALCIT